MTFFLKTDNPKEWPPSTRLSLSGSLWQRVRPPVPSRPVDRPKAETAAIVTEIPRSESVQSVESLNSRASLKEQPHKKPPLPSKPPPTEPWVETLLTEIENKCRVSVVVLHDFEPDEDDELPLSRGDLIKVVRSDTGDWWLGLGVDGMVGWFPKSYAEEVPTPVSRRSLEKISVGLGNKAYTEASDDESEDSENDAAVAQASALPPGATDAGGYYVRALHPFKALTSQEIDLSPGQILFVIEVNENGWAQGLCGNTAGWFPMGYVTQLQSITPALTALKITDISVVDVERCNSPRKYYTYVIDITFISGKMSVVKYRYSVIRQFYLKLLTMFPDESFPRFPDKILFGRSQIKQVTQGRRPVLEEFFKSLLKLQHVMESETVRQFFVQTNTISS